MPHALVVLVLFALPTLAAAQQTGSGRPATSTLPPIGLSLPPIGLPLPAIGLPPLAAPMDDRSSSRYAKSPHERRAERRHGGHVRPRAGGSTIIVFGSPFSWEGVEQSPTPGIVAPPPAQAIEGASTGWLRLEMEPAGDVQLFVDGEYVGTSGEVGGELELDAGSRRLEMRAPGYATLVLDVKIVAARTITYRAVLEPVAESPAPDAAPPSDPVAEPLRLPKQTFYVIPGCYLGNVPPQDVRLPPGCDLSRVVTWTR